MDAHPARAAHTDATASAVVRIAWSGEIDLARAAELRGDIERLPTAADVELDLTDVTFMDSTGLKLMWVLYNRVVLHGRHLVLTGVSPQVMRLLVTTGLDLVLAGEVAAME